MTNNKSSRRLRILNHGLSDWFKCIFLAIKFLSHPTANITPRWTSKKTITLTNNVFTCFSMRYHPLISFPLAKAATIKIKRSNWKWNLKNLFLMLHILNIFKENFWSNSVKFWKNLLNWTQVNLITQPSFSAVNKWMYTHYKSKAQLRPLCHSRRLASAGGRGEGCILLEAYFSNHYFVVTRKPETFISFLPASSLPEMNVITKKFQTASTFL